MGKKPENLIEEFIRPKLINGKVIRRLLIDLEHINYGSKGSSKARSSYNSKNIVDFFLKLNESEYDFDEQDGEYTYFNIILNIKNKNYRLVFVLDDNESDYAGIITFYRIK